MKDSIRIETITIDCADAAMVARFWIELLGYEVVPNHTASIAIRQPDGSGPILLFTWAGAERRSKNPMHLDLRPTHRDVAVSRAIALGARRVDVGQTGEESWVVLQDPEGNEFCILQSPDDLSRWQATAPEPTVPDLP